MSDASTPALNDDSITWKSFTSENGAKFEVGTIKGGLKKPTMAPSEKPIMTPSKKNFGIDVNWPVGDNILKDTSDDVQKTAAITKYSLSSNEPSIYAYILVFKNEETYDYTFSDKTGDTYGVDTWEDGLHYVRYNSDDPTIIYFKGT